MAIPLRTCVFKLAKRQLVFGPWLALVAAVVLNAVYSTKAAARGDDAGSETHPVIVRDIDSPAREPVQLSSVGGGLGSYIVPDGKLLIIEHVAGACSIPRGAGGFLNVLFCGSLPTASSGEQCFNLVPVLTGNDSRNSIYAFSQPIRIYSAAGSRPNFDASTPSGGHAGCGATLSGYLVDVPIPGAPMRRNPAPTQQ